MTSTKSFPALSKAPITLAIMEIRFTSPENLTNERLKSAKDIFKEKYPIHNFTTDAKFELKPDQLKTVVQLKSSHISGNIFLSASRKHEILLSTKSYNFMQHGSYSSWSEFRDLALGGWEMCKSTINPLQITWMSLRYINNIEIEVIPNQSIPAENLFKTFVANEGKNKSQGISTYALKYTHHIKNKDIMVHFGQELLQGPVGTLPFIVDIDVIYNKSENPLSLDLQNIFDELREIKNDYFFDNLTDYTLKLLI